MVSPNLFPEARAGWIWRKRSRSGKSADARVVVNRVWMYHFGRALVGTPGNFGRLGEKPSHPELLDYLAARLIEQRWSLKAIAQEIMLSATYGLGTKPSAANEAIDADNRLYWRANRRRLDVEPLRDTLLFVSGRTGRKERWRGESADRRSKQAAHDLRFCQPPQPGPHAGPVRFSEPDDVSDQRIQTATPLQQFFFLNS